MTDASTQSTPANPAQHRRAGGREGRRALRAAPMASFPTLVREIPVYNLVPPFHIAATTSLIGGLIGAATWPFRKGPSRRFGRDGRCGFSAWAGFSARFDVLPAQTVVLGSCAKGGSEMHSLEHALLLLAYRIKKETGNDALSRDAMSLASFSHWYAPEGPELSVVR